MKILITGHKGFIGQNAMKYFSDHDITTYEYDDGPFKINLEPFQKVLHFGAISSTTETNVEKIMRQNYDFTCNLIDECVYQGLDLQISSSASIYGLRKEFKETSPVDPRTPYAWSKYMIEKYLERISTGISYIQMFRYFNVYGPHEEHKGSQASPCCQFERQAKTIGKIKVFENSDQYFRDFIHVSEVLEVQKKFLNVRESGVWNVGTGTCKSFLEIAQEASSKYNVPIEEIPMPENLKHSYQTYTCADLTKLKATIG
jgi:ADP-L-glycero-D-manno-heptose 6-epimerase